VESERCQVTLELDGEPTATEIRVAIDPPDCWPGTGNVQDAVSLAAFVQPNHPFIERFAAAAFGGGSLPPGSDLLAIAFRVLRERWNIDYRLEAPRAGPAGQRIRFAHKILADPQNHRGEGNCLDLALLLAGCLERLHAYPLVAVLDSRPERHALVGCWLRPRHRFEPLLLDVEGLLDKTVWVDPTACCKGRKGRDWPAATRLAGELLRSDQLNFALDVEAARTNIPPLPLLGFDPPWDPPTRRLVREAELIAQHSGRRNVESIHLLTALLGSSGGLMRQLLPLADIEVIHRTLTSKLAVSPSAPASEPPGRTGSFSDLLKMAKESARRAGSATVIEAHLLDALLRGPGRAGDWIEQYLAPRETLLERLRPFVGPDNEVKSLPAPSVGN
jgi:hypothetical protein